RPRPRRRSRPLRRAASRRCRSSARRLHMRNIINPSPRGIGVMMRELFSRGARMRSGSFGHMAALVIALPLFNSGCTALYLLFGPNGPFPPPGATTGGGGTPNLSSGGVTNPTNTVPTTTAPAPVPGPTYRISRLHDLREATAGPNMITPRDFDFDGTPDFAAILSESEVVQLFFRNATTNLYQQFSIAGGAPLTKMVRIAAADFDGDGH